MNKPVMGIGVDAYSHSNMKAKMPNPAALKLTGGPKVMKPVIMKNDTEITPEASQKLADFQALIEKSKNQKVMFDPSKSRY